MSEPRKGAGRQALARGAAAAVIVAAVDAVAVLAGPCTVTLQNLEKAGPCRGLEAWIKLLRDHSGENGPRVMNLSAGIFYPTKVKLEEVPAAAATHESIIRRLEEGDPETAMKMMKIFAQSSNMRNSTSHLDT